MRKQKIVSLVLAFALICTCFAGSFTFVSAAEDDAAVLAEGAVVYNFSSTDQADAVNVKATDRYSSQSGYGFVETAQSIPAGSPRSVDLDGIVQNESGVSITETEATTSYSSSSDYNYGGIIFGFDAGDPGAYKITVNTTEGTTSDNAQIAVSGMEARRITGTGAWDAAGLVARNTVAVWSGNSWSYNYVSATGYIEVEVEPNARPNSSGTTVGIESIVVEPIANNPADGKPTIFILGDSTQKTYTFEEDGMSSWGQTIYRLFDLDEVNVVNYSMGGRCMRSSYTEGRLNDVLMTAKEGDYILIHSAHNDERPTEINQRFGGGSNDELYPQWLDMYCDAATARGLNTVLVSGMPRTNDGVPITNSAKPNGFDPDSPTFMKNKAAENASDTIEYVDLFHLAKDYLEKIGSDETKNIYLSLEAGESPGKTNSGSYANGHPDDKIDGTHYKEAAGKAYSKLIGEDIVRQASETDSVVMDTLASYLTDDVQAGNWDNVFPEQRAKDVTEVALNGNPEGSSSYYRNQIEKALQLGIMDTDENDMFNPTDNMKTNDFIAALCAIWRLDAAEFSEFYGSGDLTREVMAAIILDAYELKFGKAADGSWNKPAYMTDYNGTNLSPDDPNYDPNLTGQSSQYYPLVGWGVLEDTNEISKEYAADFMEVYNLGLMRSEKDLSRVQMINGTELEPKAYVTREKAAKELYFLFGLVQNIDTENQVTQVPESYGGAAEYDVVYTPIDYTAPDYEFESVHIAFDGAVSVTLKYNGSAQETNKLAVQVNDGEIQYYDVTGSGEVQGIDAKLGVGDTVTMYVQKSDSDTTKLSADRTATYQEIPAKEYIVSTVAGIQNGTLALSVLGAETAELSADATTWWKASESVSTNEVLMEGLTSLNDLTYTRNSATIDGENFSGYITHADENGAFPYDPSRKTALRFVAPSDGVLTAYAVNIGNTKNFLIGDEETSTIITQTTGTSGRDQSISAPVEAGKSYLITIAGSRGRFVGVSFTVGAPVVTTTAYSGDTVVVTATPNEGFFTEEVTATTADGDNVTVVSDGANAYSFTMPESNVSVSAAFAEGQAPAPEPENVVYRINSAYFDENGSLYADIEYIGEDTAPAATLIAASYDQSGIMTDMAAFDINGSQTVNEADITNPVGGSVKLYIWNNMEDMQPLSEVKEVGDAPQTDKIVLTQDSSGTRESYNTITEAVSRAAELSPASEDERVVISMLPGTYREQLTIDTPYITFKKADSAAVHNIDALEDGEKDPTTGTYLPDDSQEVIITWYYGIGYQYKSVGADGRYDADLAAGSATGASGNAVQRWGATVLLNSGAHDFTAEDIVFENSFNRYMTQEELDDYVTVEPNGTKPVRTANSDVAANDYNERAATIYSRGADRVQMLGCKFLSSQDTMGTGGRMLFDDCYIEGRTDYMCGGGTVVYNNCDLMVYGYSDTNGSGTFTAPQSPFVDDDYGYLFNECYLGHTKSGVSGATLGRPWGQDAHVTYKNCVLQASDTVVAIGWADMSGNRKEDAFFREYGTKLANGLNADLSGRLDGTILNDWSVLEHNPYNYLDGNDGWDPLDLAGEYAGVNTTAAETTLEIPEGTSNQVALPAAPSGYEFRWESNTEYAVVSDDGATVRVIRPANGEEPISTTITLYVRETGDNSIGTRSTIPVVISPTTDTENVFTVSGTISIDGAAAVQDVTVHVGFYLGGALIKQVEATIPQGGSSAQYEATGIPAGSYDVVFNSLVDEYKVLAPTDGATTVTGTAGGSNTIDATVARLVGRTFDITSAPTSFGSGASVNSSDGAFTVTGNGTGGAYWNISDMVSDITDSDTVTIAFTVDMSAQYQSSSNGAAIDITNGRPDNFSTSANGNRYARTNAGRWDQLNIFDNGAGATSGSSNTERQWLNCSGSKFDASAEAALQTVEITIDYKNSKMTARAKVANAEEWQSYDAFTGFPADPDKDALYMAVYPGDAGSNTFTVQDITVAYSVFE